MATSGTEKVRQRGISIHLAKDAVPLRDTDLQVEMEQSPMSAAGIASAVSAGLSDGSTAEVALRQPADEGGFSLLRLWFKPNYPLLRHSHDVDCLYYVLSGSALLGNRALRTGDSFFVPAGAPYAYNAGPDGLEILEIRHGVSQFATRIVDVPESRWQAMGDIALANADVWSKLDQSPTLAANQPVS